MSLSGLIEKVVSSPAAAKAGVPQGYPLRRFTPGEPALEAPVVINNSGRFARDIAAQLQDSYQFIGIDAEAARGALIFDATELTRPEDLRELYDFFHPQLKKLAPCARLIVIGITPELVDNADGRIAHRALEGFTRSLAKEMRKGGTCNLIYAAPDAQLADLDSTLRFFLSGKSAFVDAQVVRVAASGTEAAAANGEATVEQPLAGRLAVVTGAARGIGATIAEVLARDGAKVICVDIPAATEHLTKTANKVKGTALGLDVTAADAAERLAEHARTRYGQKIDVIVHNAGITRDKLLANMNEGQWNSVMAVNLLAPVRITEALLANGDLAANAAVVGVSSMAGIAGNRGQTNYATTKAGVVGLVDSLAAQLAENGSTINAVAPGFIETAMTAAMPAGPREIGRRINSLQQGGLPIDVAETVAFFASRRSAAVTGNTVRVCGQNLMGA